MIPGGYILQPRLFDKSESSHMSPVTRELWFYLLRNVNHADNGQHKRGSGFFNLGDVQNDLCWYIGYRKMTYSKPQLTKSLRRLCGANMIATTKATRGLHITVCNYVEYQDPKNYEGNGEGHAKETRRKSKGHTINKNGKEDKNEKKGPKTFVRPTIEQISEYCQERNRGVDPQRWFSHYTSNGWKVGKNKMVDWKAAVHTWENNDYNNGNGSTFQPAEIVLEEL